MLSRWKIAKPVVSIAFGCLLAASACATPEQRHRWATTFFDGVPPLPGKEEQISGVAGGQQPARTESTTTTPGAQPQSISIHGPYGQKKCAQCHASQLSNRLKAREVDLCFTCHERDSFPGSIRHGPFQAGKCLACHDPHRAPNKHLLRIKGSKMCLGCHDATTYAGIDRHRARNGDDCLGCHRPHAGERRHMLRKGVRSS